LRRITFDKSLSPIERSAYLSEASRRVRSTMDRMGIESLSPADDDSIAEATDELGLKAFDAKLIAAVKGGEGRAGSDKEDATELEPSETLGKKVRFELVPRVMSNVFMRNSIIMLVVLIGGPVALYTTVPGLKLYWIEMPDAEATSPGQLFGSSAASTGI